MSNDGGPTGGDLSPSQRTMRARLAAHAMHARHDGREITVNARKAFAERFEHEVDPDRVLPERERQRRADHAMRPHDTAGARLLRWRASTSSSARPAPGKSAAIGAYRAARAAAGIPVVGVAPSATAAHQLARSSGITDTGTVDPPSSLAG